MYTLYMLNLFLMFFILSVLKMEEESTIVKRKTYVQTKLNFPVALSGPSTERKTQKVIY